MDSGEQQTSAARAAPRGPSAPRGMDEAFFDTEGAYRAVRFSNGQPNWDSINGKRLGRFNVADMLTRLADDGWQLTRTSGGTVAKLLSWSTRVRRPAYHYQRQAPKTPYRYQETICPIPGEGITFNPHNAAQTEAAFRGLAPLIETFLREYLSQGWERDPYPSAVDPKISANLLQPWRGRRITGVKLRLRRPLDGADWPESAPGQAR